MGKQNLSARRLGRGRVVIIDCGFYDRGVIGRGRALSIGLIGFIDLLL